MEKNGYKIKELLGKGSQGIVYKAIHVKSKKEVAIKRVIVRDDVEANKAINELIKVKDLDHIGIAQYLDLFLDEHDCMRIVCIVMEYYKLRDLSKFVNDFYQKNEGEIFAEELIFDFLFQLSNSIRYMHSKKIMHRDLKPGNIFIEQNSDDSYILKIGDFGLSSNFTLESLKSTFCGSPHYISPEMLSGKYNCKVDLFSLGVLIYKLMTSKDRMFYLELLTKRESTLKSVQEELEKNYSTELIQILFLLLEVDPEKRPSADELYEFLCDPLNSNLAEKIEVSSEFIIKYCGKTVNDGNVKLEKKKRIRFERKTKSLKIVVEKYPNKNVIKNAQEIIMKERRNSLNKSKKVKKKKRVEEYPPFFIKLPKTLSKNLQKQTTSLKIRRNMPTKFAMNRTKSNFRRPYMLKKFYKKIDKEQKSPAISFYKSILCPTKSKSEHSLSEIRKKNNFEQGNNNEKQQFKSFFRRVNDLETIKKLSTFEKNQEIEKEYKKLVEKKRKKNNLTFSMEF